MLKAAVTATLLRRLNGLGTRKSYGPNQAVYLMGDPADALFHVESGSVKVSAISQEGKEKTLYLSGAGHFFGELCICGPSQRRDQAVALESSTVSSFSAKKVTTLLARRPELVEVFFQLLCARLINCQDHAVSLAYDSVPRRLAKELLRLAKRSAEGGIRSSHRLGRTPTHEDLAAIVGTSRGMVSTVLGQFRDQGLVAYAPHAPRAIRVFPERIQSYLRAR